LPLSVAAIVDRMMQLNPALRYQTPGEALPQLRATYADLCQGRQDGPADAPSESTRPSTTNAPGPVHTIMCIEDRHKNQDYLREYFSKHGFRVLVLSDIQRGLARLKTSPPDCMVIMGESLGDKAVNGFNEAQALLEKSHTGVVLVLGEKQSAMKSRILESDTTRVLVQPVTLRDLRKVVKRTIGVTSNGDDADPSENGKA
jgi:PleD family two-component response regulator